MVERKKKTGEWLSTGWIHEIVGKYSSKVDYMVTWHVISKGSGEVFGWRDAVKKWEAVTWHFFFLVPTVFSREDKLNLIGMNSFF
jgi:hypothetical protein